MTIITRLVPQLNDDLGDVADSVRRSLVRVEVGRQGAGSGVVLDSNGLPGALIITNAHVVSGKSGRGKGSNLRVTLNNGETYTARLLAKDSDHDVAALGIEADGLVAIKLGDSQTLRPGQWVLAMGHPWGVAGAAAGGIVIGSGGDLPERPGSRDDWIAVGLSLRPGHSGGPMVDAEGRMVGLNTMMAGLDVGMAVPVQTIKEFLVKAKLWDRAPAEAAMV
jgi:S1-C subfamily serine protease